LPEKAKAVFYPPAVQLLGPAMKEGFGILVDLFLRFAVREKRTPMENSNGLPPLQASNLLPLISIVTVLTEPAVPGSWSSGNPMLRPSSGLPIMKYESDHPQERSIIADARESDHSPG